MSTTDNTHAPDAFVGLAFPVIRVRFSGPTDHKQATYNASLRGVRHSQPFHAGPEGTSRLAYMAAANCWAKYRAGLDNPDADDRAVVFIPGDNGTDEYVYTVVPARFFDAPDDTATEQPATAADFRETGADEYVPYTVTRIDYPHAPIPGDRFGWVVAGPTGGYATHPYRDKSYARVMLGAYAADYCLVAVDLIWPETDTPTS